MQETHLGCGAGVQGRKQPWPGGEPRGESKGESGVQGGMRGLNPPGLIVGIDSNLFVAKKKQMEVSFLLSFGRGQERRCITPKPPWGLQVASLGLGPLKEAAENLKTLNRVAIKPSLFRPNQAGGLGFRRSYLGE